MDRLMAGNAYRTLQLDPGVGEVELKLIQHDSVVERRQEHGHVAFGLKDHEANSRIDGRNRR